ncbi:MAG: hydroxyethylthiazole kinase [Beduini sp.]|uniref:hydroxyethylthiazole kinase n=1 Tax=Beduini sp. TaxID=1922300 RepID=UPI00399F4679
MNKEIKENVEQQHPLIHCITNYVTVNDVANMILAIDGSPIMADEIKEVTEITSITNALVINIGTLNQTKVESMIAAGKKANELHHPVILDPVGAGASTYRNEVTERLLKEIQFTVIKGNISEIKCIAQKTNTTAGVDANDADLVNEANIDEVLAFAKKLSQQTGAVIAITGPIDVVCDTEHSYLIKNGHPIMSRITGTGCMLAGVIAVYVAANPKQRLEATAYAVTMMGVAGESAYDKMCQQKVGTSSYRTYLIDAMSMMSHETLNGGMKVEIQ